MTATLNTQLQVTQSIQDKINAYFEKNPHTDLRDLATFDPTIFTDEELKEILSLCEVDDHDGDYNSGFNFLLCWEEYNSDNSLKATCGFWISESKCKYLGFEFDRPYVDDRESWEYTWHGW